MHNLDIQCRKISFIPPTLAEATKNKTLLAKDLPKQTDIDRLMKVLNRKNSSSKQIS